MSAPFFLKSAPFVHICISSLQPACPSASSNYRLHFCLDLRTYQEEAWKTEILCFEPNWHAKRINIFGQITFMTKGLHSIASTESAPTPTFSVFLIPTLNSQALCRNHNQAYTGKIMEIQQHSNPALLPHSWFRWMSNQ